MQKYLRISPPTGQLLQGCVERESVSKLYGNETVTFATFLKMNSWHLSIPLKIHTFTSWTLVFYPVEGKVTGGQISFQLVNYTEFYLRHYGYWIKLNKYNMYNNHENLELYKNDSTFNVLYLQKDAHAYNWHKRLVVALTRYNYFTNWRLLSWIILNISC